MLPNSDGRLPASAVGQDAACRQLDRTEAGIWNLLEVIAFCVETPNQNRCRNVLSPVTIDLPPKPFLFTVRVVTRARTFFKRLYTSLLSVPVFGKVMGIALGMAVVLGGGMLWQIHRTWHGHLVHELELRGQKLADETGTHCAELLRTGSMAGVASELRHSLEESADVAYLKLLDAKGIILTEAQSSAKVVETRPIRELVSPIGQTTYRLVVGMNPANVDEEVSWLTRRLARLTAIITLLGLFAAWGLTHIFVHPILELVALTRLVKAGNYHAKAQVRANDEVGELASAFNEMTAAIAEKESARQQLIGQVIHAGEEERKRIARELHDHTGQALTSQIAGLSALENKCDDEPCRRRLAELRQQTEQMLAEVHDLSVALRPAVLDDLGLMAALERHCRLFSRRQGVEVTCRDVGLDGQRLPSEVELTIYRLVQETLTNAVRHGQATRVTATIQRTAVGVLVTVEDNGSGFDTRDWQKRCSAGTHLGLLGLEERVTLLGGFFRVEFVQGRGITVFADVPAKPEVGA